METAKSTSADREKPNACGDTEGAGQQEQQQQRILKGDAPPAATPQDRQSLSKLMVNMAMQSAEISIVYSEYVYNVHLLDHRVAPVVQPLLFLLSCNARAQRERKIEIDFLEQKIVIAEKRGETSFMEGRDLAGTRRALCENLLRRAENSNMFERLEKDVTKDELLRLQQYVNPPPPILYTMQLIALLAQRQFCPFAPRTHVSETGLASKAANEADSDGDSQKPIDFSVDLKDVPWEECTTMLAAPYYFSFLLPRLTRSAKQLINHVTNPIPPQPHLMDSPLQSSNDPYDDVFAGWRLYQAVRFYCTEPEYAPSAMASRSALFGILSEVLHWLCDVYVMMDIVTPVTRTTSVKALPATPAQEPVSNSGTQERVQEEEEGINGDSRVESDVAGGSQFMRLYPYTTKHFAQLCDPVTAQAAAGSSAATDAPIRAGTECDSSSRPPISPFYEFPLNCFSHKARTRALTHANDIQDAIVEQHSQLRALKREAASLAASVEDAQKELKQRTTMLRSQYDGAIVPMEDGFIQASDSFNAAITSAATEGGVPSQ